MIGKTFYPVLRMVSIENWNVAWLCFEWIEL